MSRLELTGQCFGKLVVLERAGVDKRNRSIFLCQCDCGEQTKCLGSDLRSGNTRSCGCLHLEQMARFPKQTQKHGEGYQSPEYVCWHNMHKRCNDFGAPNFMYYGGRGITVCERWLEYENFLADMGRKPSPAHSIERLNNGGNYEPSNCVWATAKEQRANQRRRQ